VYLQLDANGDVIYVDANNAPDIGNYCTATPNLLTGNFEIPLNDFNYYFTGQGTNPDVNNIGSSVGIGLACGDPIPLGKLHVLQSVSNPFPAAPFFQNDVSIAGVFENDATGSVTVGVLGLSFGETELNIGGVFRAVSTHTSATQSTVGVTGIAEDGMDYNQGVLGEAYGGDFNFGVWGKGGNGSHNYGVYGEIDTFSIGTNDWAGYFAGPVFATHGYTTSDEKLKSNIQDLSRNSALSLINRLTPKNYEYKTNDYPSMSLPKGNQYGLIAQEVETVLPQLVKDAIHPPKRDKKGNIIHPEVAFKAVNYTGFIPVLIGAVKEQQHVIDSLNNVINNRLTAIESTLQQCCGASQYRMANPDEENSGNASYQNVELSNLQAVVLEQNVPNPFAENTSISYFVPTEAHSARMIFYDALGRIVKEVDVEKGHGVISVFASNLSAGTYSYTLLVDGNAIETKKMLKSN
jgi:hypothetical protein